MYNRKIQLLLKINMIRQGEKIPEYNSGEALAFG